MAAMRNLTWANRHLFVVCELNHVRPPLRVACSALTWVVLLELVNLLQRATVTRTEAAWMGDLGAVLSAEWRAARLEDDITEMVMETGYYSGLSEGRREACIRSWLRMLKAVERARTMQALEARGLAVSAPQVAK